MLSWISVLLLAAASVNSLQNALPKPPHATGGRLASAWYAGWHSTQFPPSKVSWSKYTHMTYAFAETTFDPKKLDTSGSNPDMIPKFIEAARQNGVKTLISIGGWTGSRGFSVNVGSAANRTAFVKTVTSFATQYGFDGVDFDWEYPANQGIGCNTVNSKDTANFLSFLQELRRDPVGAKLLLSAAVATYPFRGPDGNVFNNVATFGSLLDWIAVMNYDIWGPWSGTVGPNAPLNSTCSAQQLGNPSAVTAVQQWKQAGIPAEKLVLGVPGYGHSFRVPKADAYQKGTQTVALYPPFDRTSHPKGDSWDADAGIDVCGNYQDVSGFVNYWGLHEQGFLNADGSVKSGIGHVFDTCSQTPYVYNPTTEVMVSYDDAQSFKAKGQFIKDQNLKGFAMWEAAGDMNDILLNAIRQGGGY